MGLLNGGEKRRRREDVFRPTRAIRKLQGPIKVMDPKCRDILEGKGASPSFFLIYYIYAESSVLFV